MIKDSVCFLSGPITGQASLRVRRLALHSNLSYGYAFRSRAALTPACSRDPDEKYELDHVG